MKQEDKELLLKDLCVRLPYNVVIRCTDDDTNYKCFLTTDILNELLHNIECYDYKLYLRPMSSMTEEEKEEFESVLGHYDENNNPYEDFNFGDDIDWLNAHHFDYRGLIEKGLALEAPEGMYKPDTDEKKVKVEIPNTVEEALAILDKIVSEEDKEYMKKRGAISVHLTLGMWIRNNWGFWGNSDFYKYLCEKTGLTHPDDISNYIIEEFIKTI